MNKVRDAFSAFANPLTAGSLTAQRILKKTNPELEAKAFDLFSGIKGVRETTRAFDRVPLFEFERKPEILTDEYKNDKKQRALVASVRRRSLDG